MMMMMLAHQDRRGKLSIVGTSLFPERVHKWGKRSAVSFSRSRTRYGKKEALLEKSARAQEKGLQGDEKEEEKRALHRTEEDGGVR